MFQFLIYQLKCLLLPEIWLCNLILKEKMDSILWRRATKRRNVSSLLNIVVKSENYSAVKAGEFDSEKHVC